MTPPSVTGDTQDPVVTPPADPAGSRADVRAAGVAVGLVVLAVVVGTALYLAGRPVYATTAPINARWLPHLGPGTPLAIGVAALVLWRGPRLAAALRWSWLLATGYLVSLGWILSLAMVDGWQRGIASRLTAEGEYLTEVGGVTDVPAMLRGFTGRILDFQPDSWTTHVSGHPPGAFLVFLALDRLGLGGGGWAALVCVCAGAGVAVAVPVTLRALGDEAAARAAMPFLVLLPGAVWIGVSADGLFAGFTATGLALLAVALTGRSSGVTVSAGVAAGALLAFGIYLSYGLTLIAVPALAVVLLALRRRRPPVGAVVAGLVGAGAVVVAFTLAGFWWFDGYHLVVERYYQGVASVRPYAYWVWADLAAAVVCAGPAAAAVLRRAVVDTDPLTVLRRPGREQLRRLHRLCPAVVLPLAALLAILVATSSGLSKAEVERIWLPFAVWLPAGAALLPSPTRRGWLAVQAGTALAVNHLLLTPW